MNKLSAITSLKIDLGIKNRKKKLFNGKHQFKNPFKPGEKFERPKKCEELHTKEPNKMGFRCADVNQDDIESFRQKLYKTTEKRDQNDFLYNFVVPNQCKSIKGNPKYKSRRMVSVAYQMEKADGKVVQICLQMFQVVTGFGPAKIRAIFMKRFKNNLLEKGDETLFQPIGLDAEGSLAIAARKEKLLNLQKGQLTSFAQAMTGIDPNIVEKPYKLHIEKILKKEKSKKRSSKRKRSRKHLEEYEMDETETRNESMNYKKLLDDFYSESRASNNEEDTTDKLDIKKRFLNLSALEVCRVCLGNSKTMIPLFRKPKNKKSTPADLLEYCLSISIEPNDNLPQKICNKCYEHVKTACKLKSEWSKSSVIMENCLEECDAYNVRESVISEVLNCYTEGETSKKRKFEDESDYNFIDPAEIKEEKFDMEPEIDAVCEPNDESESDSDENFENEISEQETFEESAQEKSKADDYVGMRPRMCFLCNIDFETTAEDHFQTAHPLVKFERCTNCQFESNYPWHFNLHMQVHADDFRLCPHCGIKFQMLPDEFSAHKRNCSGHGREYAKRFRRQCSYCDKILKSSSTYWSHIRREHTLEKNFQCSECNQQFFAERIHLKRHLLSKHGIGATCHCQKCGKPYLQRYLLKRHEKTCLKNEEGTFD